MSATRSSDNESSSNIPTSIGLAIQLEGRDEISCTLPAIDSKVLRSGTSNGAISFTVTILALAGWNMSIQFSARCCVEENASSLPAIYGAELQSGAVQWSQRPVTTSRLVPTFYSITGEQILTLPDIEDHYRHRVSASQHGNIECFRDVVSWNHTV